jgi:2-keto-4-pentenoate hydratase/2-oxohepta-3-ene-1,7-dioic acid hydratase in catechol pathway
MPAFVPAQNISRGRGAKAGSRGAAKEYKLRPGTPAESPRGSRQAEGEPMKILYFDDFKLGVLKGDNSVVDVSAVVQDIPHVGPGDLINGLIERFSSYRSKLEQAAAQGQGIPLASVRIRPPLPKPTNIDCMAVNYMEDGTRSAPAPINAFHKSPSAIIGNGDTMVLPDAPATIFEGEAELAAIIGKRASNVKAADAMGCIFGYTNFIDGSARGLPAGGFFHMKSRDTFAPIGPYIVTADEIKDPQKLQIRLWNNGTLMQNFNTDDMGHKIVRCIEWLTSIHTLEPGDIIATGTNHRGLNPFMDGDKIELETEGLGRLRFNVRDDLKRTWARKTRLQMHEESNTKTPGNYPDFTPQLTGKYAKAG